MLGIKRITGAAGPAPEGEPGAWVSDVAREKFMAAYERVFALWPQPREEFDVETATATTRVHAYRPHPGGPPVVLLTGAGGNAAAWFPHVAALAGGGPVYGIDMPGDANPSVAHALMTPPENCAAWLDELLGKLSDRPAHLVGFSYGGWVAMNQAIRAPERVASITLLDPGGLTKLDARFWWWLSIRPSYWRASAPPSTRQVAVYGAVRHAGGRRGPSKRLSFRLSCPDRVGGPLRACSSLTSSSGCAAVDGAVSGWLRMSWWQQGPT